MTPKNTNWISLTALPTYKRFRKPRWRRLAKEHENIHDYCDTNEHISYEIDKSSNYIQGFPPEKYRIRYQVKSITGVTPDLHPIYGNDHYVTIAVPLLYPMSQAPICFAQTSIWHPNIRYSGDHKGHICANREFMTPSMPLSMVVQRICDIIQYKNYLALDKPPYPEDMQVARWVREYGEPKNIVQQHVGIIDGLVHIPLKKATIDLPLIADPELVSEPEPPTIQETPEKEEDTWDFDIVIKPKNEAPTPPSNSNTQSEIDDDDDFDIVISLK